MNNQDGSSYDPGWNDPPMFSYEHQTAKLKASKPRTFLNKRVAFPLNQSSQTSSSEMVDPTAPISTLNSLPPPPSVASSVIGPPPVTATIVVSDKKMEQSNTFNSDIFKTVTTNLNKAIIRNFGNSEKDEGDVKRRLNIMETMWREGKLGLEVQQRLLELSEAMEKDDVERSDELQKGLMVDHASVCSQWMSGIRHIINFKLPQPNQTIED